MDESSPRFKVLILKYDEDEKRYIEYYDWETNKLGDEEVVVVPYIYEYLRGPEHRVKADVGDIIQLVREDGTVGFYLHRSDYSFFEVSHFLRKGIGRSY